MFQKENRRGKPFELFLPGGLRITHNKCCTFIHLAERTPEGGWLPPKTPRDWLNIPAPKDTTFTQIQLNKQDDGYFKAITGIEEWAYFRFKKGSGYLFYGIFKLLRKDKRGVCVFKRISTVLKPTEWIEG